MKEQKRVIGKPMSEIQDAMSDVERNWRSN